MGSHVGLPEGRNRILFYFLIPGKDWTGGWVGGRTGQRDDSRHFFWLRLCGCKGVMVVHLQGTLAHVVPRSH